MYKGIMGFVETERAALNIREVEKALGHPIPNGMVDYKRYGEKVFGFVETEKEAHNIRSLEASRANPTVSYIMFENLAYSHPNLCILLNIAAYAGLTAGISFILKFILDII